MPGEDIEGVVYLAERNGEVEFLAKFVKPDKVDGKYMIMAKRFGTGGRRTQPVERNESC